MAKRRSQGEGTVYYEASRDRWIGAVMIDGKRRKRTGKTKTEARTKLNELLRKRDLGEAVGDGNITLNELLQRWIDRDLASRGRAPATVDGHRWAADRLAPVLGATRVRSLSVETIEDAFDDLSADGLSTTSLRKIRNTLSQAMKFGVRRGLVTRNLAEDVLLPAPQDDSRSRTVLTGKQVRQFLDALDGERLGAMYALAVTSALRPTECAALRWDAVDLDEGTVSVEAQRRHTGVGTVIVDQVKTKRSARRVRLADRVCQMLRDHRDSQQAEQAEAERWDDPTLVFATATGTPLDPANVRRDLKRILERAKLPVVTPYELRHTAASLMSDAEMPLESIADVMGHADTRMLERTYRHRLRPTVDAAAGVMNTILDERDDGQDAHLS